MEQIFIIWAVAGTIVAVAAFGLVFLSLQRPEDSPPVDCSGLGFGACLSQSIDQALNDIVAQVCFGSLLMLFGGAFALVGILLVGMIAGGAAVRRIRRLEPGILGRQAFWVVLGWGLGAILAAGGVLYFMSLGAS